MTKLKKYYLFVLGCIVFYSMGMTGCGSAEVPNIGNLLVHVVKPISSDKILPFTAFVPGKRSDTLFITACRGELEPASFVIHSDYNNVINLTLKPTELRSGNNIIPPHNIDIKVVKVWYQGGTAWRNIRANPTHILVPEILLNDDTLIRVNYESKSNYIKLNINNKKLYKLISGDTVQEGHSTYASPDNHVIYDTDEFPVEDSETLLPINIPSGQNKQLWITVKVPNDAVAGNYTGEIFLNVNGNNVGKMNMEVRVLPFDLEPSSIEYSIYYRGKLVQSKGSISSEYKSEMQMRAELMDMWEHGVKNPTVYQPINDKNLLKRVFEIRKNIGMVGQPIYYLGLVTNNLTRPNGLAEYVKQIAYMLTLSRSYGATDLYIYGIDEASEDQLRTERPVWNAIHSTGAKVFVAGWEPGHFKLIGGIVDLFVDGQPPLKIEADKFHKVGGKIFSYNQPQVGVEDPSIYRKNYGIRLWQQNYDGAMDYAYQDGFGSVWNDFDDKNFRDHNFTYPTINGVIDTIAWEGFREGVDDVRYINTLEKRIALAFSSGDAAKIKSADEANIYLSNLRHYNGNDMDEVRNELVRQIMKFVDPIAAPQSTMQ